MLRNRLLPLQNVTKSLLPRQDQRIRLKSNTAGQANRQGKIFSKLFGNRLAGSKKRWYPANDAASSGGSGYQPPSVIFQASQFGKSSKQPGAKHNTRRMSVLNKLFMTHITDLLAAGTVAESILGRGLQVTRVKVTSDFACINVYWLGSGELHSDVELETELQRCSGLLRHELSQLRLMGEVPRIKFVRDKTGSNSNSVETLLRTLNLSKPAEHEELPLEEHHYDVAQTARQEFYGNAVATPTTTERGLPLPEMRHDVLGLDHGLIMGKILTKMRKSKQAWEQHEQQNETEANSSSDVMMRIQRQLAEAEQSSDKFDAFLAKRRDRKQTPERKKYRREEDQLLASTAAGLDDDDLQLLSPEQRQLYYQEDYIEEEEKPKSHS